MNAHSKEPWKVGGTYKDDEGDLGGFIYSADAPIIGVYFGQRGCKCLRMTGEALADMDGKAFEAFYCPSCVPQDGAK